MRQSPESERQKIDKSIRVNVCLKPAHAMYKSNEIIAGQEINSNKNWLLVLITKV